MVHGLFGLGVGSALFLESLDFGAVTKVTILLATTIALIQSFVWMWAAGVPVTGTRPGALRLVINIAVAETDRSYWLHHLQSLDLWAS